MVCVSQRSPWLLFGHKGENRSQETGWEVIVASCDHNCGGLV